MFDFTRTLAVIKGAIFDPEPTWDRYLQDASDWKKTAILLTGPLIVVSVVLDYALDVIIPNRFAFTSGPSLLSMLMGLVMAAVAAVVIAFVFAILAGLFKGKNSFPLALAATTLAFVPGYLGRPLMHVPYVGWLLSFALGIYGLILLWRILPKFLDVPPTSRVGHYIASLVTSVIAMMVIGLLFGANMIGSSMGTASIRNVDNVSDGAPTGMFGEMERQGRIMESAQEDSFDPPGNGELSKNQVQSFVGVLAKTRDYRADQAKSLEKLSEKAESGDVASISDALSGMSSVMTIGNAEMEVVKTGGGNWAEHQWVREQLRVARIQKDINDAVKHNYGLYQEFKEELSDLGF